MLLLLSKVSCSRWTWLAFCLMVSPAAAPPPRSKSNEIQFQSTISESSPGANFNFFEEFANIFGWGSSPTEPPKSTSRPTALPAHAHTAPEPSLAPYYGKDVQHQQQDIWDQQVNPKFRPPVKASPQQPPIQPRPLPTPPVSRPAPPAPSSWQPPSPAAPQPAPSWQPALAPATPQPTPVWQPTPAPATPQPAPVWQPTPAPATPQPAPVWQPTPAPAAPVWPPTPAAYWPPLPAPALPAPGQWQAAPQQALQSSSEAGVSSQPQNPKQQKVEPQAPPELPNRQQQPTASPGWPLYSAPQPPASAWPQWNIPYRPHYAPPPSGQKQKANIPNKSGSQWTTPSPKKPERGIPNKGGVSTPTGGPRLPGNVEHLPFRLEPSPLPLPPEPCHSKAGLLGECMSAQQCGAGGGTQAGLCHAGRDVSLHARVCCTHPGQCGTVTNHEVSYLQSPGYPATLSQLDHCPYTVHLLPGVCQLRLDFLDVQLAPLQHGVCSPDNVLTLRTGLRGSFVPTHQLCGRLATDSDPLRTDGPHLYVHYMEDTPGSPKIPNRAAVPRQLELNFKVTDYSSKWNIRVSQITCDGAPLEAPPGCAQYYNAPAGNITSLNLAERGYPAATSLDLCLAPQPGACAVKYNMREMAVGPTKGGGLGYGLVCSDFLKFRGEKTGLCGRGTGRQVVLPVRGPAGLTFTSDSHHIPQADVGYNIEYEFLHECSNLQYFKYPK